MDDLLRNTANTATATVSTYIATYSNPDCCPEMSDIIFFIRLSNGMSTENTKIQTTWNTKQNKMFKFALT